MTRPRNIPGPHRPGPTEPIPAGQLWPLHFLHTRCGYGSQARAAAIKAGLPVYRWSKRAWIYTDDLIDFLRREGRRSDSESGGEAAGNGAKQATGDCTLPKMLLEGHPDAN
jgi:hypothetical protein